MLVPQTHTSTPGSETHPSFEIVVIAASAGGIHALIDVLAPLPAAFPLPILIVQHLSPTFESELPTLLGWRTRLAVKWAEEGEWPESGVVYVAPPSRHLAVTAEKRLSLQEYAGVTRYKPDANHLFESVARVFGKHAIGIVLSGMLNDGARGAAAINAVGGLTMAQSECSSEFFDMPAAAIDFGRTDLIASPCRMSDYLLLLGEFGSKPDGA
jgi:two-component system chemotaxis response regulator CheB